MKGIGGGKNQKNPNHPKKELVKKNQNQKNKQKTLNCKAGPKNRPQGCKAANTPEKRKGDGRGRGWAQPNGRKDMDLPCSPKSSKGDKTKQWRGWRFQNETAWKQTFFQETINPLIAGKKTCAKRKTRQKSDMPIWGGNVSPAGDHARNGTKNQET